MVGMRCVRLAATTDMRLLSFAELFDASWTNSRRLWNLMPGRSFESGLGGSLLKATSSPPRMDPAQHESDRHGPLVTMLNFMLNCKGYVFPSGNRMTLKAPAMSAEHAERPSKRGDRRALLA